MEAYQGYWQAFWLLGGNHYESNNMTIKGVSWPECGEIDIFELYGARKNVQSTYHTKTDGFSHVGGSSTAVNSPALDMNKYHIYALEWTENKLQYSVDGVVYGENDISGLILNGKNPFDKAYYILFNFAIGGTLGGTVGDTTPDTSNMYVDWVRIYAPKNSIYPDTLTLTNYEHDTVSMNVNETKRLIFDTTPSNALMPTIKYKKRGI